MIRPIMLDRRRRIIVGAAAILFLAVVVLAPERAFAHNVSGRDAAFVESNPMPIKAGLAMMGRIQNVLRLPLVPLSDAHTSAVRTALQSAGALQ